MLVAPPQDGDEEDLEAHEVAFAIANAADGALEPSSAEIASMEELAAKEKAAEAEAEEVEMEDDDVEVVGFITDGMRGCMYSSPSKMRLHQTLMGRS